MGFGKGDVEHRQAIDVAADRGDVRRQQARIQLGRLQPALRIARIEFAEQPRRRRLAPMWRPQPRDAAAFLVDQDRRLGSRHAGAQVFGQAACLIGSLDVAGEEDEAQRIGITEERALVGRQEVRRSRRSPLSWSTINKKHAHSSDREVRSLMRMSERDLAAGEHMTAVSLR
jgi:hypothetical protein